MVRVVLFGWLLVGVALAAPAGKSGKAEKEDTADQAAKAVKPYKAAKPEKSEPAAKSDQPATAAKAAKSDKAAKTGPDKPADPQGAYEGLLRERDRLEWQKKVLGWEDALAEASLQDSSAYLVVDLDRQVITAKLGGVPMRDAPIQWRYERPGQTQVSGIFQVGELRAEVPDSAAADTSARQGVADSAAADTTTTLVALPRGPTPRYYDPQKRFCIGLQGGPDIWLAALPLAQSRMDSLKVRMHLWYRDFPAVVQHRQSIHLFMEPEDSYWIYAMAAVGARVLVIPPF